MGKSICTEPLPKVRSPTTMARCESLSAPETISLALTAAVDVSPDSYRLEAAGLTSSQLGPLRENGNSFLAHGELPRSQFHFLWPNFGINVFPGRPNLSCGPMVPIGPERTARYLDYFFAPGVEQSWVDELIAFDGQVGREDVSLVESVQRGVRTGVLEEGRLLSESEQLVAHFQALTRQALEP